MSLPRRKGRGWVSEEGLGNARKFLPEPGFRHGPQATCRRQCEHPLGYSKGCGCVYSTDRFGG